MTEREQRIIICEPSMKDYVRNDPSLNTVKQKCEWDRSPRKWLGPLGKQTLK